MAQQKKVRILSLDGGGIRGIIPATIIQYAEAYLQKKRPNCLMFAASCALDKFSSEACLTTLISAV